MTLPLVLRPHQALTALAPQSPPSGTNEHDTESVRMRPIDLRSKEAFADGHIPDAVRLDAALLNRKDGSVSGLLPEPAVVNAFVAEAGLNPGDHVLAYDAGATTEAARLIWVLQAYGFMQTSWLDGGYAAWQADGLPTTTETMTPPVGTLSLEFNGHNVVTADTFMNELPHSDSGADTSSAAILDVRSAAEFEGSDVRSARGGHVPGADHVEWTRVFGPEGRLLDDSALRALLGESAAADNVVVYCQSHQRSAVTYVVLKHLGVDTVRAIDGAWSSWGNREDTPVETGR